jgi:GntR family transcriptional regulator/MocR family aminotransferase
LNSHYQDCGISEDLKELQASMPKQATPGLGSEIPLDHQALTPLYRQLYERLRGAILTGQLESGTRLPSTRTLASELGVSRTTTALAYEQLQLEGYIESRVGDGTRVTHLGPIQPVQTVPNTPDPGVSHAVGVFPSGLARRGQLLINTPVPEGFYAWRQNDMASPFRIGEPDVTFFPYKTWARLLAKHARRSLQALSFYRSGQGYAPLCEAIAAHIGVTRGVHCSPEQVIVTTGAQGALDLVARVLLDPGDQVWIEDPGYAGARGALLAAGAQLIPVPVDREGLDVEAGRRLCPDARLAVVTPSHQFPTGVTMSLRRRLALLEWATESRGWIVEDDYDSEYRYGGRPLEALQCLDRAGRVLYIGTFSKVLFPSLRLGYLIVPREVLQAFLSVRFFIDIHQPVLEQMVLADFLVEKHFMRHLRNMRLLYLERRNALVDVLTRELGDLLDIVVPEAGLHLVAWLLSGKSAQGVSQQAQAYGLSIPPVSDFSMQPLQRDGLMLGFAGASPQQLRAGVHTLAHLLRTC